MADFGSPVAVNIDTSPNKGIQTLSGLLGLQQQRQALQGQAAEVQQAQQTASQRAGIANFYNNWDSSKHVGPDGTLDLDSVLTDPKLRHAAGDQFPTVIGQMIDIKNKQLQSKQQLANLNDSVRTQFQGILGGLRTDPDVISDSPIGRDKVQRAIGEFASTGPDAARIAQIYGGVTEHAPPGKLVQAISNLQLQAMDASTQAGRQAPTLTNTGARQVNVNPQAAGGELGGTGDIRNEIGPARQPFTDSFGRVFNYNPQTGNYEPANAQGKGGNGPGAAAPGDVQALTAQANQNFANVNSNRVAASLAPQQLDQINKALDLSKTTSTGNWATERSKIESGISSLIPGFKSAQDDATKLQLLDKFAERIAADSARVLGANASTDAARDSIHRQNANVGYTPEAVQSVLKYAKAQTLAMQAKGDAQEKWLKSSGNGITNQHDFETQWRQSYDPVIFQLEAANPAERVKIVQGLLPEEAQGLAAKRAKLRELGVTVP